jgi:hypothetical protein
MELHSHGPMQKERLQLEAAIHRIRAMELRDYFINLCRNTGMESGEDFREAFEFTVLSDGIWARGKLARRPRSSNG